VDVYIDDMQLYAPNTAHNAYNGQRMATFYIYVIIAYTGG